MMATESRIPTTPPTQFGVFSPRGYVVAVFPRPDDAESARRALLEGGYDPGDVMVTDADSVRRFAEGHLASASAVSAFGGERDAERQHLALAKEDHAFLMAYAPSDAETERVMNVVRRFDYAVAHKYGRFTLQIL